MLTPGSIEDEVDGVLEEVEDEAVDIDGGVGGVQDVEQVDGEDEGDIAATHPNQSPGHPHVPLLELPMLGFKTRLQFYDKSQLFKETQRFLKFILYAVGS